MAKHWYFKNPRTTRTWFPRHLRFQRPMQKGKDVYRWQTFLVDMHCGPKYTDGIFGPDTEQCSRHYLVRMGLLPESTYCIVKRSTRWRLYLIWWLYKKLYPIRAPLKFTLPEFTSRKLTDKTNEL